MSIEVKNVFCTYGRNTGQEVKALSDISFRIEDGEFVGIMGRTGCGKSTLIQLIGGLLEPSSGQVLIDGADIHAPDYDRAVLRRTVGIVFQHPEYQLFETTVEKDVAFALKHSGLGNAAVQKRVRWALETVGFCYEEIRGKSPLALSGGEKRRVAIAGVLVSKPSILIFDEPIAGLDPHARRSFLEFIAKLNRDGTTVLMVSHNADCLCEFARRILVLNEGELAADGKPEEIFCSRDRELLHVGVSSVQYIAERLYQKGVLVSPNITKYAKLTEEIRSAVTREGSL